MRALLSRTLPLFALAVLIPLAACGDSSGRGDDDDDGGEVGSGGSGGTTGTGLPTGAGGGGTTTSGAGGTGGTTGAGGSNAGPSQLCVDTINQHRASIGLPPYERWADGEACASDEARSDGETNTPHGAFPSCGEWAQNECPGWPGPAEQMIVGCLQMMWDEGPGDGAAHGHYNNMSSQDYTRVACGFHTFPDGSVWAVQNFQ